jgi:hypothetical protein
VGRLKESPCAVSAAQRFRPCIPVYRTFATTRLLVLGILCLLREKAPGKASHTSSLPRRREWSQLFIVPASTINRNYPGIFMIHPTWLRIPVRRFDSSLKTHLSSQLLQIRVPPINPTLIVLIELFQPDRLVLESNSLLV